ncbi:restriction endonuclease subunit S [Marinobacter flavimaris]|uniref:restriction endonuclease subunit S n=1 Tax=Marinobacter flavimaris TaxID=262076 RepID=UPI00386F78F3
MSWQRVELANVATVFNGKTPAKAEQRDNGHPVLKIKDVDVNGAFKGDFGSFVDSEFAEKFSSKKISVDDTLVLNAAHNSDYVGSKQYRAEASVVDSLPTGEWLVARADEEQLHPRFLNYWLSSPQARFQIKNLVKGIHLYPKDVARLEIPLPALAEQKRIATILDKADAIRRKRQQAIQLADEFLRAVFLDMFGDPATNPKGWEVKTVSDCLAQEIIQHVQDGNHGNDHPKVSEFIKEGIPFLTANVIRRGKILFDRCYYLGDEWLDKLRIGFAKPRDVLISHKGSLGFTAVLDTEFENYILSPQTTYYRVDENRLIPEYLKAYFDSN